MGSRRDAVMLLAPPAPPCFGSRLQWLEYLASAAEAQKDGKGDSARVLLIAGGTERFNMAFAFCRDCSAQHHLAMTRQGKCQPDHLLRMAAQRAEVVE